MKDMYEKARVMGLDERQIALAQMPNPHGHEQQTQVEAHARVAIHALAYDHPGEHVVIERYGIGMAPFGTVWIRRGVLFR